MKRQIDFIMWITSYSYFNEMLTIPTSWSNVTLMYMTGFHFDLDTWICRQGNPALTRFANVIHKAHVLDLDCSVKKKTITPRKTTYNDVIYNDSEILNVF